MADVGFGELRDRGDGDDILVSEAVAGVRFDAVLPRERGGVGEAAQFGGAFLALDMRVAAGVEFDDGGEEAHRRLDLARVGFAEQAAADARVVEAGDDRREGMLLARPVAPALGQALLALFGTHAERNSGW